MFSFLIVSLLLSNAIIALSPLPHSLPLQFMGTHAILILSITVFTPTVLSVPSLLLPSSNTTSPLPSLPSLHLQISFVIPPQAAHTLLCWSLLPLCTVVISDKQVLCRNGTDHLFITLFINNTRTQVLFGPKSTAINPISKTLPAKLPSICCPLELGRQYFCKHYVHGMYRRPTE